MGKVLLIAILLLFSCAQINVRQSSEPLIVMQRTACYGQCPQYKVSVYRNGTISYEGKLFVDKIGCFSATIPLNKVKKIKSVLEELDFFILDSLYKAPMTDIPSVITEVVINNKKHKVIDEYKGPKELKNLYYLIDSITDSVSDWTDCVNE